MCEHNVYHLVITCNKMKIKKKNPTERGKMFKCLLLRNYKYY